MTVRNALWMAGLGSVFAWPMLAMAQDVTAGLPTMATPPALMEAAPTTGIPSLMPGVASEGVETAGESPVTESAGKGRFLPRLGGLPSGGVRGLFTPGVADGAANSRFWFTGEGLLMWTKNMNIPPLVTTGPVVVGGTAGVLGQPGTLPLIDKSINFGSSVGGRFTLGGWVLPDVPLGLEVSYLFLAETSGHRGLAENGMAGSRFLSVPFFDAVTNVESASPIAFPTGRGYSGTVDVRITTRLQGFEVTAGTDFGSFCGVHFVGLAGYRNLSLQENLTFSTTSTNTNPLALDVFRTTDNFHTANDFHGGQIGLRSDYCVGPVTLTSTGKVALGHMRQQTRIDGSLVTNDFNGLGVPQTFNSGYLATDTNSGTFGRDRIAIVPEFQFAAGWQPISWLRLSLGYQVLYINEVARPGDQIDRVINTSQVPAILGAPSLGLVGPARPIAPVAHSDFWVQGLTAGLEFKF